MVITTEDDCLPWYICMVREQNPKQMNAAVSEEFQKPAKEPSAVNRENSQILTEPQDSFSLHLQMVLGKQNTTTKALRCLDLIKSLVLVGL